MSWTAIIPFKGRAPHKTRLGMVMSADARRMFAQSCLMQVSAALREAGVSRTVLLCDAPPPCWRGEVAPDLGRGLNTELNALAAQLSPDPIVTIQADLPLLCAQDVAFLFDGAADGIAIAPDRHDAGTNAIALPSGARLAFAFGTQSLARHCASAGPDARLVRTAGLGFDVDTPCDMADLLARHGGHLPAASASMKRPSPPRYRRSGLARRNGSA